MTTPYTDEDARRDSDTVRALVRPVRVPRFWLQPTASFPDGAPQREEYLNDASFALDCALYDGEWWSAYVCGDAKCQNRDCPQHGPNVPLSGGAASAPYTPTAGSAGGGK